MKMLHTFINHPAALRCGSVCGMLTTLAAAEYLTLPCPAEEPTVQAPPTARRIKPPELSVEKEPSPDALAWQRLKARFSNLNESVLEDTATHQEEWNEPLRHWETEGLDTSFLLWAHQSLCSVAQDAEFATLNLDWLRNIVFHELLKRVCSGEEASAPQAKDYVGQQAAGEMARLLAAEQNADNDSDLANILGCGCSAVGPALPQLTLHMLSDTARTARILSIAETADPALAEKFAEACLRASEDQRPHTRLLKRGTDCPNDACNIFFRRVLLRTAGYREPADVTRAVAWAAQQPDLWLPLRRALREKEGNASIFQGVAEEDFDGMLMHMLEIRAHRGMSCADICTELTADATARRVFVKHAPAIYANLEDDTEGRADLATILNTVHLRGNGSISLADFQQTVESGDFHSVAALAVLADAYGANAVFPWLVVTGDLQESERVQVETQRGALRTRLLQAAQADAPEPGLQPLHKDVLGLLARVVYKKADSELFLSCLHRPGITKARRLQKAISEDIQWLRELQGRGDFPLGNLLASALETSACACGEIEQYISPASAGKQDASPARTPADSPCQTPAIRNGVETINK